MGAAGRPCDVLVWGCGLYVGIALPTRTDDDDDGGTDLDDVPDIGADTDLQPLSCLHGRVASVACGAAHSAV